ncbi:MAG: c-type cytochrome [Xanthomonadales bacterium]|nr:cytochrome c [Gammaproteobacteria bacterium]MBT8052665.1 cytochrome c [Gammaproteobacteria bacterium]NNK52482.1 c-type cytochrome [Xanthomonadales bacterium]
MGQHRYMLLSAFIVVTLAACAKEEPAAPDQTAGNTVAAPEDGAGVRTLAQRMARGGKLYAAHCAACHQASGQGLAGAFPPLAGSDYLEAGPAAVTDVILNGLKGPITVNGMVYNSVMPNMSYLGDGDVADVVTFVMNSWGNPGGEVSAGEVSAARSKAVP